jgi:iron-sulfur cluster repair protein YtfE (RIC family)
MHQLAVDARGEFAMNLTYRFPWRQQPTGLRIRVDAVREDVWTVVERIERCDGAGRASRRGRKHLATVEQLVVAHFAREEGGGHLEDALKAAPRYHNHAQRLREEHGELLRELRAIRELAEQAETSPEGWAAVYRAYDAFAEHLQAHDEAENEIMARAVLEDLGPGD